mgnify:CR=1 FL=1
MKFRLPHQQIEFEIPNERWVAAGTGDVLLPIEVDEPPTRTKLRYRVHDGFHRFFTSDK